MNNVLVLGGTGFVGRAFAAQWVNTHGGGGPRLNVVTRRIARGRDELPLPTIDLLEGNVHDDAELAALLVGRDAVVNLIGVLHGSRAEFERAHTELPRRLAQACATAGVRRVVHVSALGVGDDAPSNYLQTKTAGEAALRAAPLALTVFRPSVMFGAEDRLLNLFAQLQRLFPVMPLAGADAKLQPVWVDDVAQALVRALKRPDAVGQTYEAVGPTVVTLAELVRCAGRWSGHPRPVIALPAALATLQAMVMEALPGEPLLSRDNLASLKAANVASGRWPTLQALGIEPAAMGTIAPQYLARDGLRGRRLNAWRAVARRG